MNMKLDNNNAYNEKFYPDQQENELQEYSQCYSCSQILYVGDSAIDWNDSICCDDMSCVVKMIDAKLVTLESGEE